MKIAVFGAGPSGMMAAHAAFQYGAVVEIFDKDPDKSRRNSGVYFLHNDCDLILDEVIIKQKVLGAYGKSAKEISKCYSMKVYGQELENTSVLEVLNNPEIIGYNSSQAIERLWDLYYEYVKVKTLSNYGELCACLDQYDKIICTVPAPILFPDRKYKSIKTWAKVGKASEKEAFMFYNINENSSWYRCSGIFGVFVQEFAYNVPLENCLEHQTKWIEKVIGFEGELFPNTEKVFFTGRYGAWDKSCLTDDVYYRTLKWLRNDRR